MADPKKDPPPTPAEPPVKRGRGRPPKPKAVPVPGAPEIPKRGRGRPRKVMAPPDPLLDDVGDRAEAMGLDIPPGPLNDRGEPYEPTPKGISASDYLQGVFDGTYVPDRLRIAAARAHQTHTPRVRNDRGSVKQAREDAAQEAISDIYAPGRAPSSTRH